MERAPRPLSWHLFIASQRAYHQIADDPPIYVDPLAVPMTGLSAAMLADAAGDDPRLRYRRLSVAASSRFTEDGIVEALAMGIRQVVILNTGLSTFAYRNLRPDVDVFEVDENETLRWKGARLADMGVAVPANVRFVPAAALSTIGTSLARAGFRRSRPSCVSAMFYLFSLPRAASRAILEFSATLRSQVQLLFDYTNAAESSATWQVRAEGVLESLGTPWISSFTKEEVVGALRSYGFTDIADTRLLEYLGRLTGDPPHSFETVDAHLVRAVRTA